MKHPARITSLANQRIDKAAAAGSVKTYSASFEEIFTERSRLIEFAAQQQVNADKTFSALMDCEAELESVRDELAEAKHQLISVGKKAFWASKKKTT